MLTIPFFANLAYTMLAYLITYATGSAVLLVSGDTERSLRNEFRKNAFGAWILITVYSVCHTGAYTLSTGLLLLAFISLIVYRPAFRPVFAINYRGLLFNLVLLFLFFTLLYFQVYDPLTQSFRYYSIDLPAQATLVEKLNATGLESTQTDFYFREPLRNLYHYGDLWFPALFSKLFHIRAMPAVHFIFTAIGATVVTGGAMALADTLRKDREWTCTGTLLALGFIGLSGISFYVPKTGLLDARWAEHFTMIGQPKIFWMVMSVLYASICLLRNDRMGFTLSLLTAAILYVVAAPALLAGWFVVVLYCRFSGRISTSDLLKLSMLVVATLAFFSVYILANRGDVSTLSGSLRGLLDGDLYVIKSVIFTFVYTSGRLLISGWPFLLMLYLCRNEFADDHAGKSLLFFLFGGITGSVAAYSIFFFQVDGFQLWTVPYAGLAATLVFLVLLRSQLPFWVKWLILGLCWLQNASIYTDKNFAYRPYQFDKPFVRSILREAAPDGGPYFALIRRPVLKASDPLWGSDPNQFFPYDLLKWELHEYHPYNISLLDTQLQDDPVWAEFQRAYLRNSTFGKYVAKQRAGGAFVSVEACQLEFIREAKIRFLLIEPGAKENMMIEQLIERTFTDPQTGYRFCVLRMK